MEGRKSPEIINMLRRRYMDRPLYEVVRAGEQVEQTMASPGWAHIMEALDELQARAMHNQATNPPREMEKYVRAYGFIQALPAAADAAVTVTAFADEVRQKLNAGIQSQEAAR